MAGHAQYTLFSPALESALLPFPAIHAAVGQAQRDVYDGSLDAALAAAGTVRGDGSVFQTTLAPGETLLIPAYWYVHSEATGGLSAVLDVPSASLPQLVLNEAFFMALPLGPSPSPNPSPNPGAAAAEGKAAGAAEQHAGAGAAPSRDERIVAAQVFLVHVLSRVVRGPRPRSPSAPPTLQTQQTELLFPSPRAFAAAVYERYALLYPKDSLALRQQRQAFQCLKDSPTRYDAALASFVLPRRARITAAAQFVAGCVNDMAVSEALRRSWLVGYAESIARFAMRDAQQALAFVLECLDQDKMVEVGGGEEEEGPPVVKMAV